MKKSQILNTYMAASPKLLASVLRVASLSENKLL